jgi:CheY-like chemotaxis protein
LTVLVAEDDAVNSKIMAKRLSKVGHDVHLTVNGEECASAHGDRPTEFDVVLMDMQVRRAYVAFLFLGGGGLLMQRYRCRSSMA